MSVSFTSSNQRTFQLECIHIDCVSRDVIVKMSRSQGQVIMAFDSSLRLTHLMVEGVYGGGSSSSVVSFFVRQHLMRKDVETHHPQQQCQEVAQKLVTIFRHQLLPDWVKAALSPLQSDLADLEKGVEPTGYLQ
jgi:hypothetical protein